MANDSAFYAEDLILTGDFREHPMHPNNAQDAQTKFHRKPLFRWLCLILIAWVIGIIGCASPSRLPLAANDGVPLPDYQEGTTFVYSNGRSETVHEVTPDRVTWQNHRGYISAGSPDFTYRRTAWQTRTRSGTRSFKGRNDWLGNPVSDGIAVAAGPR